ncbi:MAG: cytochrome c [Pseudomonadota bacterium]
MKVRNLIIAAAIAATPMFAQAAGDAAAGKAKAVTCAACHGANGKAAIPTYPNLAGQNAGYLEVALKDYKNGKRTGTQAAMMTGMAKPLSDADIANLAAYFSSL